MSEESSRAEAFEAVAEKALGLIDEAISRCEPTEYAVIQKLAAALVDLHAVLGLRKDQLDREEQAEKIAKLRLASKDQKGSGGVILLPSELDIPEEGPELDSWLQAMACSQE